MANDLTGNPKVIDTASGSDMTNLYIQKIEWVDDGADLAASDDLVYVINGVTVTVKPTAAAVAGLGYHAGPFPKGVFAKTFVVSTIDHGSLLVWVV